MVLLSIILTSACLTSSALAWTSFRNLGQQFLSGSMHPEVVAKTLSKVEIEWKLEATKFIRCEASSSKAHSAKDCQAFARSFNKSCAKVVSAIVQGSNGDKGVTREYMVNVCGQSILTLPRQDMCTLLARDLTRHMSASTYENRINFKAGDACDAFWSHYVADQRVAHQSELDAIKAAELDAKKAAEAAKQKRLVRSEVEKRIKAVRAEVEKRRKVFRSEAEKQRNSVRSDVEHTKGTIQGEWDKATIQGNVLFWKTHDTFDGWPIPLADDLFKRTNTSVEMKLWDKDHSRSKLYRAGLFEDGKLHWSNGDVWVRTAGQLTHAKAADMPKPEVATKTNNN